MGRPTVPRSARAELRHDRSRHSSRCTRTRTNLGVGVSAEPDDGVRRQLRAQQADPHDRGRRLARCDGQRGLLRRATPAKASRTTMFVDRADRAIPHAEAAAAVRRARPDAQPPLLEQLVRQRQRHDQPAVWQLRRAGELGRNPDADDRRLVGDGAAAGRQHRAPRHRRRPRLGPRRARVGFAREPRRARPPGHRSSGRREVLRRLHAAVRHAGRRRSSTPAAARR